MKRSKIIYCVYCGTRNSSKAKRCTKCYKKLNPQNHPLLDYLKSKISDKFIGDIKDNALSIIINYIKSHLYGFVLTCSIIISTTCIVNNIIDTPKAQNVTEKPKIEQISYSGVGKSAKEVTKMYIEALQKDNLKIAKSLQLATYHSKIIKDLEEYINNNPTIYPRPVMTHDFLDNRKILLRSNITTPYIYELSDAESTGYFDNYHYIGFQISIPYCSYTTCTKANPDYYIKENVYLIEVDNNYYILGEEHSLYMSIIDAVQRRALFNAKGDTANLSFEKAIEDFDNCNLDETCLERLGYTNLYD